MGSLVLILAIVLFSVLAFQKVSALILAPIVTLFVAACFRIPLYESLAGPFMSAGAEYVRSYFLTFFVGALFGAVYQFTDAATSIAHFIAKFAKGRFVAPIVMIITGILTYGGVSGFVVFFVMYPIALSLFKEANLSRVVIPGAISAGCWTWSMSGPGSPSIQNVIASDNLGTHPAAALTPSIISTIAMFVLIFVWLEYRTRKLSKMGRVFDDPTLQKLSPEELETKTEGLPNPYLCFVPIILILFCFNVLGLHVVVSVSAGVVLATILFWKRVGNGDYRTWIEVLNTGAANSTGAILNTAIVVGFAGLIRETQAFTDLIEGLKSMAMSPMLFVAITVAVAAGAAGSASGGMGVAFAALKDTYLALGLNPQYIHRIATIAAGTLDTLPHQGAQITLLNICKLSHKDAYLDIAVTQIIIPFISLGVFITCASMGMI